MSRINSCFVPTCKNTRQNAPKKAFIHVPKDKERRMQWWIAAKCDFPVPEYLCYCCEDHFDLENDVANYMFVKLMGGKIVLKESVVPHKFENQECIRPVKENHVVKPRKRKKILEDENTSEVSSILSPEDNKDEEKQVDSSVKPTKEKEIQAAAPSETTAAASAVNANMSDSACFACMELQTHGMVYLKHPNRLWNFLADHDLVLRSVMCAVCKCDVEVTDFTSFRCNSLTKTFVFNKMVTQQCRLNISARKGTFFELSNLALRKIVHVLHWFVVGTATYKEVSAMVEVPLHRLIYWYRFCNEIVISYCLGNSRKIGGPGVTVKITEAKFRENIHSGSSRKSQWVVGGFDTDSKCFFMIPVPDRQGETIKDCIKKWVLPETEIISDSKAVCSLLSLEGYTQKTVRHSAGPASAETSAEASSQLSEVEQELLDMHQDPAVCDLSQEKFVGQLSMAYFKLVFPDILDRFHQFLQRVAAIYPPQKEDFAAWAAVEVDSPANEVRKNVILVKQGTVGSSVRPYHPRTSWKRKLAEAKRNTMMKHITEKPQKAGAAATVCAAVGCQNNKGKRPDLSFFWFPVDTKRCERWVISCGRAGDFKSLKASFLHNTVSLCAEHFDESQFTNATLKNELVWCAEPTIFPKAHDAATPPEPEPDSERPSPKKRLPRKQCLKDLNKREDVDSPQEVKGSPPRATTPDQPQRNEIIECVVMNVTENGEEKVSHGVEIDISEEQHASPGTAEAEDPLALSPCHPALEEDSTDESRCVLDVTTSYGEGLSQEQRDEYYSKLALKKWDATLPDPYNIKEWVNGMEMCPDLHSGHIHQYLLCSQAASAQGQGVVAAAEEGYTTFKVGNVLTVENCYINCGLPVCFLKAKVKLLRTTAEDTHVTWVCLEETQATVLASHCTCLTRFKEVCSHIMALLFKVEAAVALGMNHKTLDSSSSKLAIWSKRYRPKTWVACVRDMNIFHPSSGKRHKELYKQLNPQPLSESEQEEALAQLKKILPNAPVFMTDNTDAGAADAGASFMTDESSYDEGAFEASLNMEDAELTIKTEVDESSMGMETTEMPFRIEEAEMPFQMEEGLEGGEVSPGMEFIAMPFNMDNAEVSVKSEDDVYVKIEDIDEDSYILESG